MKRRQFFSTIAAAFGVGMAGAAAIGANTDRQCELVDITSPSTPTGFREYRDLRHYQIEEIARIFAVPAAMLYASPPTIHCMPR